MSRKWLRRRPNILFIIVDEERFPPAYEEPAIRVWSAYTCSLISWTAMASPVG
jgi:hypothetical protein